MEDLTPTIQISTNERAGFAVSQSRNLRLQTIACRRASNRVVPPPTFELTPRTNNAKTLINSPINPGVDDKLITLLIPSTLGWITESSESFAKDSATGTP
jgi:hypothetical protein